MLNKYLQDKSPQLFRPKVTPDPVIQMRLAERVESALERARGSHLSKSANAHFGTQMSGSHG